MNIEITLTEYNCMSKTGKNLILTPGVNNYDINIEIHDDKSFTRITCDYRELRKAVDMIAL